MAEPLHTLVEQMTLAEKAALCTGDSMWTTTPVERLDIPRLLMSDGPHGIRRVTDIHALLQKSEPATCFPTASGLAATWDVDLLREMGQALAQEAIALDVDVLLGPGANMKRTPLCGRNFEYFSEDPHLAGKLAAALIDGVQSRGVGASLKHFVANNQEFERFSISAEIDERTLHEIYLRAFEIAVTEARPWTVMCAYNKINGTYASEHAGLLTDTLKEEWGFEGLVVSDWGAVHDRVAALQAGLDLEMPGPKPARVNAVIEAVHSGELDEALLDEAARRILRIVFKAAQTPKNGAFDAGAHHALARKVAAAGIVLLKNDGILPLQTPDRIAVIGRAAKEPHFQGGGSSHINPTRVDIPFDALQQRAGAATLTYAPGYPADDSAFYAYSTHLMSKIAGILGMPEDAETFHSLSVDAKRAFREAFVNGDGTIVGQTQTGYVLALHFDLLPADLRAAAANQLAQLIRENDNHLSTGFVGTPYISWVLSESGHLDTAYTLLNQQSWPSWLYSVLNGGTTIWERWDGWTQEKGFQDPGMNSFNHYAYGAIGAWIYANVGGIDFDPDCPGYKQIKMHPRPGGDLTGAKAELCSMYGRISSAWSWNDGQFDWRISVPANTSATIHIPASEGTTVLESGQPAEDAAGVSLLRRDERAAVFTIASGEYHFATR